MTTSAVLAALTLMEFLRVAGVIFIAFLIWWILGLVSSLVLKRAGPRRGVLFQIRYLLFPAVVFFVVVRFYWPGEAGASPPPLLLKIAKTVLATAVVLIGMGVLDLVFTPSTIRRIFRRDVPQLFLDVGRYLLLILAVAVILKNVWEEDVTPLIGALGIGGIAVGLALQETLSNFFGGLAILAERPFSIGDWVRVGEGVEGQVEHVTWRAVKIRTGDNEYVIYPNSMVAKEKVVNFSLPTPVQAARVSVGTSYQDPPDLVKRTIREVLGEVEGVLKEPAPLIFTTAYADSSINYEIKFFIRDFSERRVIQDQVMSRIWYAFRRRGIEIPFPIRTLYHHGRPTLPPGQEAAAPAANGGSAAACREEVEIREAIRTVPIFADLSREEREAVARAAVLADYGYGEGNFFGEMSLLTGEPRSASVYAYGELRVVEVRKAALAPILSANPALAAKIAEVVVLRREGLDRVRAQAALEGSKRAEVAAATNTLLGRIRSFFALGG